MTGRRTRRGAHGAQRRNVAARLAGYQDWADFLSRLQDVVTCEEVAVRWKGIRLKPAGSGWMISCPFHPDCTPSCHVDGWVYHCFGASCQAAGDAIDFTMRLAGTGFVDTALMLASEFGLPVPDLPMSATGRAPGGPGAAGNRRECDRKAARLPEGPASWPVGVPPEEPDLDDRTMMVWFQRAGFVRHRADAWHEYRDMDGRLVGLTARTQRHAGKVILPVTWRVNPANGKGCWVCKGYSDGQRPVYGRQHLGRIRDNGTDAAVLLVDGEKTADAAARLLGEEGWAALSVMGGCKSAHRADWTDLAELIDSSGRRTALAVWPDADRPTESVPDPVGDAADRILAALEKSCPELTAKADCRVVVPSAGLPHGWGLDDAEMAGRTAGWVAQELAGAIAWKGPGSIRPGRP